MDSTALPVVQDHVLDEFFVYRHGRRMSAMAVTYPLPLDEDEVKRFELHHRMMQFIFSGKNYVGPVKQALQFGQKRRILDLGTGSGQWAIDMADEFPSAEVLGLDICPIQPRYVPPNCTFEICDLEDAFLPYASASFDLIHARDIQIGIRDYPRLLKEIARLLRPGGLVLLIESDLEPVVAQDGSSSTVDVASHGSVGASPHASANLEGTSLQRGPATFAPNMAPSSDSNSSHSSALASPIPSRPSPWQQHSASIDAPVPVPSAAGSHTILTTNRQLNALLNPVPQTPVPIWSSAPSRNSGSPLGHGHAPEGVAGGATNTSTHIATSQTGGTDALPLMGSPRPTAGSSSSSTSGFSDSTSQLKMQHWLRLWSVFREGLKGPPSSYSAAKRDHSGSAKHPEIDPLRARHLSRMLAETGLYEAITTRQANVPVGFWPRDPHLLTVGQLQWMEFELLIPSLRPFLLSRLASGKHPTNESLPSTEEEVDKLIKDAQQDFYSPVSPLFARIHIVYGSKTLHT